MLQGGDGGSGEHLFPPPEGGEQKVVDSTHQTGDEQWLGLLAALLPADEHLGGGSCLGEGELAVHITHKILAEGDEHEYAQQASQQ